MQCVKHPDRIAVDTCLVCGNGVCIECRGIGQLCCNCMEKREGLPHRISAADMSTMNAPRSLGKKRNLIALILMTALYAGTLWTYLSPWRGGALSISALASIAVAFILQLVLLLRDSILTKSAIIIAALINLILASYYGMLHVDSTGLFGLDCMIIIVPLVLFLVLHDVVSENMLIGIIAVSCVFLAVLLGITFWYTYWA